MNSQPTNQRTNSGVARSVALAAILVAGVAASGCATHSGAFGEKRYPVRIEWKDAGWCVPLRLKHTLRKVSRRYGKVTVHSTHRWPIENWIKGGKSRSYHLTCRAVDFSVNGDPSGVVSYLKSLEAVGGYKHYPQGFYHIDTGPRRTW